MWVLSCSFKWPAIEKLLSHFDHWKIILCGSSFCHTLNIWKAFLLFWSSHNYLRGPISRSSCHILSIWKASPLCGSSHAPSRNLMLKRLVTLCAFELNSSWVDLLMGFQVLDVKKWPAIEPLLSHFDHLKIILCLSFLYCLSEKQRWDFKSILWPNFVRCWMAKL